MSAVLMERSCDGDPAVHDSLILKKMKLLALFKGEEHRLVSNKRAGDVRASP